MRLGDDDVESSFCLAAAVSSFRFPGRAFYFQKQDASNSTKKLI
jgi:hypothetical protein